MLQFGQGLACKGIKSLVTFRIPASIPLQTTAATPLNREVTATVRIWEMMAGGINQRIRLRADLPKKSIRQVFLAINGEAIKCPLKDLEGCLLHDALQKKAAHTVYLKHADRRCQHSHLYTVVSSMTNCASMQTLNMLSKLALLSWESMG